MAINLAEVYAPEVERKFTLDSLVFGKGTAKYDWTGTKKVRSITPTTVALGDYDIADGDNILSRFGTLTEVQDEKNEYDVANDKSFNLAIDKGNNQSQMLVKKAGTVMKMEVEEQIIPALDKYALSAYKSTTGVGSNATAVALTKANIVEKIADGIAALANNKVPTTGTVCWIGASEFSKLVLSPEFLNLEKLGEKAAGKGVVGQAQGAQIIRVPDSYMPANTGFILAHPSALMPVKKIETLRILEEHPDVDGSVLQGRIMFDAFVLKQKVGGVYFHKTA